MRKALQAEQGKSDMERKVIVLSSVVNYVINLFCSYIIIIQCVGKNLGQFIQKCL